MAAEPQGSVDPHAVADAAAHGAEHANGGGAFPPFDATLFSSQLIWFALTFGVLYFFVSRFVIPRVGAVLEKRAAAISSDLDAAAQKSAAAEEARTSMEKAVARARADARAMIDAARADITAKLTAEQESAEKRLIAKIEAAEAKVNEARAKALAEIPALSESLAREIADKLAPVSAARQRVEA